MDVLWRIIDTYNEDLEGKVAMVTSIFQGAVREGEFMVEAMENLSTLVDNLIERTEEMNTKRFSILLCREVINSNNIELLRKAVQLSKPLNHSVIRTVTEILIRFLKFFEVQKRPPKDDYKTEGSIEILEITDDLLREIVDLMRLLFLHWFRSYPKGSPSNCCLTQSRASTCPWHCCTLL